jgi:predicted nucleic acid-binding protein
VILVDTTIWVDHFRSGEATEATNPEVLHFVESNELMGLGIGWIDAHLLASARLSSAVLWTRDTRLRKAASSLALAYAPE